jgi:hypothetical protein
MSVSGEIGTEAELYCSPSDVTRFIRPRDPNAEGTAEVTAEAFHDEGHVDGPTTPTRSAVIKHIEGASVRLERKTQQAWRANTVTNETHDHKGLYYWLSGHPIDLIKREIRPLDASKGDKLEVYTGRWENWLTEPGMESGRDGDYWIDGPNGLLWVYERAILRPHPKFRITYRYGYDMVPHDVREAVAKRAAADIITGDFYGTVVPGNQQGENADPSYFADIWREDFKEVARDYKKISFV